ncbi:MAG TPA: T9SS type A sorting domain-containing protein [Bacteroidales bacterium]|nr:T9SS type A sorting domain-containing protein [Bacteroidales bacterium]
MVFLKQPYTMKKLLSIVLVLFAFTAARAQWITSMHTVPPAPTDADIVYLVVEAQFPSGACSEWYILNQHQTNYDCSYDIVNCVGVLAYICGNNDTIIMGQLPAGNYTVIVNLNAGSGARPCPPFAQWTADTIHFIVSSSTGSPETEKTSAAFKCYPVPESHALIVLFEDFKEPAVLEIFNITGQLLMTREVEQAETQINTGSLATGIYVIKARVQNGVSVVKFFKE